MIVLCLEYGWSFFCFSIRVFVLMYVWLTYVCSFDSSVFAYLSISISALCLYYRIDLLLSQISCNVLMFRVPNFVEYVCTCTRIQICTCILYIHVSTRLNCFHMFYCFIIIYHRSFVQFIYLFMRSFVLLVHIVIYRFGMYLIPPPSCRE